MKDYTHKFKKTDDTKRVLSDVLTIVFRDNSKMLPYSCNITSDDAEENFTVNMSFKTAKPQQSMSSSVKKKFTELEDRLDALELDGKTGTERYIEFLSK